MICCTVLLLCICVLLYATTVHTATTTVGPYFVRFDLGKGGGAVRWSLLGTIVLRLPVVESLVRRRPPVLILAAPRRGSMRRGASESGHDREIWDGISESGGSGE